MWLVLLAAGVIAFLSKELGGGNAPPPARAGLPPPGALDFDAEATRLAKEALFLLSKGDSARGPVALFQQHVGLPVTAEVDQATHDAMLAASTA